MWYIDAYERYIREKETECYISFIQGVRAQYCTYL
jgi:hypothetical protein